MRIAGRFIIFQQFIQQLSQSSAIADFDFLGLVPRDLLWFGGKLDMICDCGAKNAGAEYFFSSPSTRTMSYIARTKVSFAHQGHSKILLVTISSIEVASIFSIAFVKSSVEPM